MAFCDIDDNPPTKCHRTVRGCRGVNPWIEYMTSHRGSTREQMSQGYAAAKRGEGPVVPGPYGVRGPLSAAVKEQLCAYTRDRQALGSAAAALAQPRPTRVRRGFTPPGAMRTPSPSPSPVSSLIRRSPLVSRSPSTARRSAPSTARRSAPSTARRSAPSTARRSAPSTASRSAPSTARRSAPSTASRSAPSSARRSPSRSSSPSPPPTSPSPPPPPPPAAIGKVFKDEQEFAAESKVMRAVSELFSDFAIVPVRTCRIQAPTDADLENAHQSCNRRHIRAGQGQIVYPHGGQELRRYANAVREELSVPARIQRAAALFRALEPLVRGIETMDRHRVLHNDLKPVNVLVGADGKMRVIDWGMMKAYDDVYVLDNAATFFESGYVYWPPEFNLLAPALISPRMLTPQKVAAAVDRPERVIHGWGCTLGQLLRQWYKAEGFEQACESLARRLSQLDGDGRSLAQQRLAELANRADVFSLGVIVLEVVARCGLLVRPVGGNALPSPVGGDKRVDAMLGFAKRLLHPDPVQRTPPTELVARFERTCDIMRV